MVRAAFDHFSDVFGFLVDWHSPDDGSLGWWGQHFDLNGTCLGDLAVQLFQFGGVLNGGKEQESQDVQLGVEAHQRDGDGFMHTAECTCYSIGIAFVQRRATQPDKWQKQTFTCFRIVECKTNT